MQELGQPNPFHTGLCQQGALSLSKLLMELEHLCRRWGVMKLYKYIGIMPSITMQK
jgi:hypothetical protein